MSRFSWSRFFAVALKEFIQMRRDRLTFAMMVGIPLMQLGLFGFAINTDPKYLPTAVINADQSEFSRTFLASLKNSGYFDLVRITQSEAEADQLLASGRVQFVVNIPLGFSRDLLRAQPPTLLIEADASDPSATSNAIAALNELARSALLRDLKGSAQAAAVGANPINLIIHRRYNPEGITQYNIVPGLMGVILTMTMIMMTGLAVTRERERGTMEHLLAMPVNPLEVMLGKIMPYIFVGYIQVVLTLLISTQVFQVPIQGSLVLLLACVLLFIAANLSVGMLFSTIARNQMQAMQMTFFFFLPSMLLSGFMFPFRGMPVWAQRLGEVLPLTHFLRLVRGIMLKGNGLLETWPHLWPLMVFMLAVIALGLKRFKRTLD